jgi:ketosteroid isomerase-like protein
MKTYAKLIISVLMAGFVCWRPAAADDDEADEYSKTQIVQTYTAAFNSQDADAMAALMHPDFEWMVMTGNGLETITSGREVMTTQMRANFNTETPTQTRLSDLRETSSGVYATETATWQGEDGEEKSQSTSVFYAITSRGLIRRIQYLELQSTEP